MESYKQPHSVYMLTDPWKTIEPETEDIEVRSWRRRFYNEVSNSAQACRLGRCCIDGLGVYTVSSWCLWKGSLPESGSLSGLMQCFNVFQRHVDSSAPHQWLADDGCKVAAQNSIADGLHGSIRLC